jgi:hypothetical protein
MNILDARERADRIGNWQTPHQLLGPLIHNVSTPNLDKVNCRSWREEYEAMATKGAEKLSSVSCSLGELVEEYNTNTLSPGLQAFWLQIIVVMLLAGCCMIYMLWAGDGFDSHLATQLLCFGAVVVILGVVTLWKMFHRPGIRILLFEEGFVHQQDRLVSSFRWEEIAGVDLTETEHRDRYHEGASHYTHSFRIRTAGGREVVVDDAVIGGGEELGRTIMREVQHVRLKGLLKRALSLEAAGERDAALDAFERLLRKSPYNEIAKSPTKLRNIFKAYGGTILAPGRGGRHSRRITVGTDAAPELGYGGTVNEALHLTGPRGRPATRTRFVLLQR